jgi:beta-glucosidase/6-phospho-beta-glucosidase/beta-galactosidase
LIRKGIAAGRWNSAPSDNKAFARYAAEVAGHFKGRVDYWEVWNEPDSITYWKEQDGLNLPTIPLAM